MADKEERILIDIIQPGLNCVYRMHNDPKGLSLCKHNGEEEPVSEKDCNNCLEGMTRQEAIEKMAKAICLFKDDCHWAAVEVALRDSQDGGATQTSINR